MKQAVAFLLPMRSNTKYEISNNAFSIALLYAVFVLPFVAVSKSGKQKHFFKNQSIIERLEYNYKKNLDRLDQIRQKLWDTIKNKRVGESDYRWINRLNKYGFTTDGTHIKSGIKYESCKDKEFEKMQIDIKKKLKAYEGETFYTVTGKPYTYKFIGENLIKTSRTSYHINLSNFERALEINPIELSEIKEIWGYSYIYGIITDNRFRN